MKRELVIILPLLAFCAWKAWTQLKPVELPVLAAGELKRDCSIVWRPK